MRVVRSPDSVGVALGCAAELVHWTASIIVCLLPSTMTVVLGAVALELGEVADWPPLLEQAERPTPITTTLSPPTARTSRRPIRWRLFGSVIAVPSLGRHEDYRACAFPEHLASPIHGQASQRIIVRNGPAKTGRTAVDRQRCSTRGARASAVA